MQDQKGDDERSTESHSKRVMLCARKSIRKGDDLSKSLSQIPRVMMRTKIQNQTVGEPKQDQTESSTDQDCFMGRSFTVQYGDDGQQIRLIYKEIQLTESIYPDLDRAFESLGFDKVDGWDLLTMIAVGGAMYLKGPRYDNEQLIQPHTMKHEFMVRERALVSALMTTLFSKQANVPYRRHPISFQVVHQHLEFVKSKVFRKATIMYHAEPGPPDDLYRVIISGSADDLCAHKFEFEPSSSWIDRRYPERR